jgi:hypothetical protein
MKTKVLQQKVVHRSIDFGDDQKAGQSVAQPFAFSRGFVHFQPKPILQKV